MPGRNKKPIDRDMFEKYCAYQCTRKEIADFFDVSEQTIDRRVKEWGFTNFAEFFDKYSAGGKMSLRRWQYAAAEKGNVTMLIWLGKQYLGQRDVSRLDTNHEVKGMHEFLVDKIQEKLNASE